MYNMKKFYACGENLRYHQKGHAGVVKKEKKAHMGNIGQDGGFDALMSFYSNFGGV